MQKSTGKCVTLMTVRFSQTNSLSGIKYRRGISSQANMLLGAMYENNASFLTMEMVLIAKRNWCSSLALDDTAMKEFVKTVIRIVLDGWLARGMRLVDGKLTQLGSG